MDASLETLEGLSKLDDIGAKADPEFMTSLSRGLTVLQCFAEEQGPLSIARASQLTGLSRGSVRRCLHTLQCLGFAEARGSHFMLLPRVLRLGYAFLSSDALATVAQPLLARAAADLGESCSLGIRDGDEVCYLARAEASRIMSIALRVGSRLPLYCTSMGRVLLAHASPAEQKAYLDRTVLTARTADTVTDPEALLALLRTVREQGYALVDQELEIGLRSIAVPVFGRDRTLLGALNVGAQSVRVSPEQLLDHYLPALQQISVELGLQGVR